MNTRTLGSRESRLALWQAHHVKALLREAVPGREGSADVLVGPAVEAESHTIGGLVNAILNIQP